MDAVGGSGLETAFAGPGSLPKRPGLAFLLNGSGFMRTDVVVLGAGIVGVSIAVHLQQRGRSVLLVDKRKPGEETSFGNAGLIQREGVYPYGFPHDFGALLRYALNNTIDAHYHLSALPKLAPFLFQYWMHSRPEKHRAIARLYAPLDRAQSHRAHGAGAGLRRDGSHPAHGLDEGVPFPEGDRERSSGTPKRCAAISASISKPSTARRSPSASPTSRAGLSAASTGPIRHPCSTRTS